MKDVIERGEYENVRVRWTAGHKPTLYLKNDAGEVEEQFILSELTVEEVVEKLNAHGLYAKTADVKEL